MQFTRIMDEFQLHALTPPITKRKLAAALGTSERSIFNYQIVAITSVDDFLSDYPTVDGKYATNAPLTLYQAFILSQIKAFLDYFPSVKILQDKLENHKDIQRSWSKAAFMAQYPEYSDNSQSSLLKL